MRLLRPLQWTKNALVLAALVFSRQLLVPELAARCAAGFVLFCLLSSAAYIANDLHDVEADLAHPLKRRRPLAAGEVSRSRATLLAVTLGAAALAGAFALDRGFAIWAVAFLLLQMSYTFMLRRVVLLDVLGISLGFVMRAGAGAALARVTPSPWLMICTFLLALFLALAKRRHELVLLEGDARVHRLSLGEYSAPFLDQALAAVAAATIVSYAIYTLTAEIRAALGTDALWLTLPLVVFGVLRYLYLVHRRDLGGDPAHHLLSDPGLLASVSLWILLAVVLIYAA
jgi:4-hydroxybenzoate polyprenyltransferase